MPSFQLLEQARTAFGLQERHELLVSGKKLRLIEAHVKVKADVRRQSVHQRSKFVLLHEEGAGLTRHFGEELGTRQGQVGRHEIVSEFVPIRSKVQR